MSDEADHAESSEDDGDEGEDDDEGVLVVDQRVHERLTEVAKRYKMYSSTLPMSHHSTEVVYSFCTQETNTRHKQNILMGGSPCLGVMGGDLCSKGCEFESRHCIQDGHFFTLVFVVKICNLHLKRRK